MPPKPAVKAPEPAAQAYNGPSSFVRDDAFCDIKLQCGEKVYITSKFLICSYSGYLRKMLKSGMKEAPQETVEIKEDPVLFAKVMQWIYCQRYDGTQPSLSIYKGNKRSIADDEAWVQYYKGAVNEQVEMFLLADRLVMPKLCKYVTSRLGAPLRIDKVLHASSGDYYTKAAVQDTKAAVAAAGVFVEAMSKIFSQPLMCGDEVRHNVAMLVHNRTYFGDED